jgi:RNA polymerase sigma-70 factor, ECF subfamily
VDATPRFEQLYRAHADAVAAFARRRSDALTADEVVADVFLVVWRRLEDVPEDPLPWLLGVARRALANRLRSAAREQALHGRMRREMPDPATATPAQWDLDEVVLTALRRVSERDREVLLLVAWEGLTPAQGAAMLGMRPNTFSTRLSRARRRFRRALAVEQAALGHEAKPTATGVVR